MSYYTNRCNTYIICLRNNTPGYWFNITQFYPKVLFVDAKNRLCTNYRTMASYYGLNQIIVILLSFQYYLHYINK